MLVYLPGNLGVLIKSAAQTPTKWEATTGIKVVSKDGTYRVEATDGRRLVAVQGPNEDKQWPNMEECVGWEGEAIVPADSWQQVFNLASVQDKKNAKKLSVADRAMANGVAIGTKANGLLLLATFESTITASPVEGRFPNTNQVWGYLKPVRMTMNVDPGRLIDVCQVLQKIKQADEIGVKVLLRGPLEVIGFQVSNVETGQIADAVLMPLAIKEEAKPKVKLAEHTTGEDEHAA